LAMAPGAPARARGHGHVPAPPGPEIPPLPNMAAAARTPWMESPPTLVVPPPLPRPAPMPAAGAPPAPEPGPNPASLFTEKPTHREQPEIRITNEAPDAVTFLIDGEGVRREWSHAGPGIVVYEALMPGEYRFELRGSLYRRRGIPDVAGTLRC